MMYFFFLFAKGNNLTCRLLLVIEQTYLGYLQKQIIRVKLVGTLAAYLFIWHAFEFLDHALRVCE